MVDTLDKLAPGERKCIGKLTEKQTAWHRWLGKEVTDDRQATADKKRRRDITNSIERRTCASWRERRRVGCGRNTPGAAWRRPISGYRNIERPRGDSACKPYGFSWLYSSVAAFNEVFHRCAGVQKAGLEDIARSTFRIQYPLSPLFSLGNSDDGPSNALTFPPSPHFQPLAGRHLCFLADLIQRTTREREKERERESKNIQSFFDLELCSQCKLTERDLLRCCLKKRS